MAKRETYTEETTEWWASFGTCWLCGKRLRLCIHHFVRGSSRCKNDIMTTAVACWKCHEDEHRGSGIGYAGWLALKRKHDPEHYRRQYCNLLRGHDEEAVTEAEVDAALAKIEE